MLRSLAERFAAAVVTTVVLAVVAVVPADPVAAQLGGFTDVADEVYYSVPVMSLAERGVFVGTECDDGFCPDDPLDRKTMAVWVVRLLDSSDPAVVSVSRFDDVDAASFYAPFIERLAELGVTTGCGEGSGFCPDRSVSRAQMAVFLSRAYKLPDAADPGFSDVPAGAWYRSEVAKLAASEITRGCGDGTEFCPSDDTTRAQMATFLHRAENRPEPEASTTVPPISAPLARCAPPGVFDSGRVSVLVGTLEMIHYEPVVAGGPDSCERIMAWWDDVRQAEAERIARGEYPCEAPPAYGYFEATISGPQANGPAMFVGCWPRVLPAVGAVAADDPAEEETRYQLSPNVMPPNHPAMVEALYGCYRQSLEGPPTGWVAPDGVRWPDRDACTTMLYNYSLPLLDLGVNPECAARQYTGLVSEFRDRGVVIDTEVASYGGSFSWANCPTSASRLLDDGLDSYTERCEAVTEASADHRTDQMAATAGTDRDEVVATVKAMFCEDGTKQTLIDRSQRYQDFVPNWTHPYGEFVAHWTPPEGSVCYEAAMLVAAQHAIRNQWMRVRYC